MIWFCVSAFAVLGTLLMASTVWQAYRASPTQTIVENPSFPVWNVDFPALTICNLNKVQHSRAKVLMGEILGSNVDNETEKLFMDSLFALGMLRYPYYHHAQLYVRRGNKNLMDFGKYNLTELMMKVMAKQNEMFGTCYWKGKEIPCNVAFRLQITEEGFCYSFNSQTSEDPNPPDMDSPPFHYKNGKKQPWRNNAAGKTTGLEVFFKSSEHEYLPGDQRTPGYNLIVHHPSEFPDVARALFLTRTNKRVTLLAATASRVKASPELARLSLEERGCTLDSDGQDEVQENCKARCRVMTIVKQCQCVPYFGVRRVPVSFGGLAGLFLGFSLISAVEMLYYTLHQTRNLWNLSHGQ
ncbi:sodium channel protein Nach-like [Neocloeon triangulifer]|uniref:sodium channel protein Nach-like n=1 Tax=Neocloeon triangulifer TaxID=2078957 RepID=UPI00286F0873|nr:sodium channel protein Nach-like [Neocloeon triangulifer]